MYQIIGKLYEQFWFYRTFVLYDYDTGGIFIANEVECRQNNKLNGKVVNFDEGTVTDGAETKLPVYNREGIIDKNKIPVVIERVVFNGETVGYTVIDENGVYKKFKTEDLIKRYKEFFNAKVVTKDGKSFISAKRGTFPELDLKKFSNKSVSLFKELTLCSDAPDYDSFICNKADYDISGDVLQRYKGTDKKIRIPEGVRFIHRDAFNRHKSTVEEVILPSSFSGASDLKKNSLRDCFVNVKSGYAKPKNVYVADRNRLLCSKNGIVFSKDMKTLVFYPNKEDSSYRVPDGVKNIAYGAFSYSTHLKELTLSNSVENILQTVCEDDYERILDDDIIIEGMTYGCNSLTSINVLPNSKWFTSIDGVLFDKSGTALELYPAGRKGTYTIPNGVEYIDISAFSGCKGLTGVKFPKTLIEIFIYAFLDCNGLEKVVLPSSIKRIEDYAFYCKNLKDVTVLGGSTEIFDYAFYGNNGAKLHCIKDSYVDRFTGDNFKEKVYIGGKE